MKEQVAFKPERDEEMISQQEKSRHLSVELIHSYIVSKNYTALAEYIEKAHPADIAEIISSAKIEDALYVFRLCDKDKQKLVFVELGEETQAEFVGYLKLEEIAFILEDIESDDATSFIAEIEPEKAEEILNSLDSKDSAIIRNQMSFAENSAGRLMSSDYAVIKDNETASKGISSVRRAAKETENIYLIYVTDQKGIVKGFVQLKDLLLSHHKTKINKIMKPVQTIHYNMDQEEVARFFRKYDVVSAPVVDDEGKIIGRISVDDVLDVVEEEASEDILRLGGLSEDEKLKTSIWDSVKRRIIWLGLNLVTAMLVSTVVSLFEETIQRIVVLASLMPIVAGMGGNAGTQAITIVVRNLATGELTLYNWYIAVRKELIIGILNGFVLGSIIFTITFIVKRDLTLASVIGSAMLFNMIVAGLIGSVVPLILKFFKIDPAIASSIFVTACTDTFGFFCFLGLASFFL
ncbi:MAG TPA: magnesium transporter [Leptospiraceae bacterium]|nr:magnesium transporter [Leptospiraceae bacterium]HMW04253.1 magnesium transporter [Leptospiraceae bacterium]HMX30599.1 magnesium transporter [Leptospiraceae bacterium]HMY31299.1 magnesium transporter [Leptospiraceae bacterium]HMZ63412.1 magnesium transporter [Leptospiraceae bacterium]